MKQKGYMIFSPKRNPDYSSFCINACHSKANFMEGYVAELSEWITWYKMGWRCKKVEITVELLKDITNDKR